MMSRKSHGQSNYTPTKQRHLQMFLDASTYGWRTLLVRNPKAGFVFVDTTAGSGFSDDGLAGSPLILNHHFLEHKLLCEFGGRFHQLCCDQDRKNIESLATLDLKHCDLRHGKYEHLVADWLDSLPYPVLFGLIYCDPNGFKPAMADKSLYMALEEAKRTEHIDLLFNVSLNAIKRHQGVIDNPKMYNGNPPEWLTKGAIKHLDELASLKKQSYIRNEYGWLEWIMLYCMNTARVRQTRRTEGIIPYTEWRENAQYYLNGGIKTGPGQMRLL